jgi:hypothetical protein
VPSGNLDSDLRVALLAVWVSGHRRLAADLLRQSADKKTKSIVVAEPTGDSGAFAPPARWYTDLRAATAKALLIAQAEVIRAMAEAVPRKLAGKPKRSAGAVKM